VPDPELRVKPKKYTRIAQLVESAYEEFTSAIPWLDFQLDTLKNMRPQGHSFAYHEAILSDRVRRVLMLERLDRKNRLYDYILVNDVFGESTGLRACHEFFVAPELQRVFGSTDTLESTPADLTALPAGANPVITTNTWEIHAIPGEFHQSEPDFNWFPSKVGELKAMTAAAQLVSNLVEPLSPLTQRDFYELGQVA